MIEFLIVIYAFPLCLMFSSSSSVISTMGMPVKDSVLSQVFVVVPEFEPVSVLSVNFLLNCSRLTRSSSDKRQRSSGMRLTPLDMSLSLVSYSPSIFCRYTKPSSSLKPYHSINWNILLRLRHVEYFYCIHNSFSAIDM